MTFNKKRQCCCNADTGPKYLEVFPEIDSTSEEKQLSGTYSYWIFLGDVANEPGTNLPAYDTVIFEVLSNTKNTNATSDIEFQDYDGTVFVSSGKFDCATNAESSWKELVSDGGENYQGVALARRGFTWNLESRFLTESQLFALDGNRIRGYLPGPSSAFGPRAFDEGYFFVSNQYDETPAISENLTRSDGETFNYVVYPKISANLPDRIYDEDGTIWFDFTVHFPASLTLTFSGTGDAMFRFPDGSYGRQSYTVNYSATYDKEVLDYTDRQLSVFKYVLSEQPAQSQLVGPRVPFVVTFQGPDGPYDVTVNLGLFQKPPITIFATQNRYNAFDDVFAIPAPFGPPDREYIYQRHGARLNKNFTQNQDACYIYATDCDGLGTGETVSFDKSPYNYAGTTLSSKNSNAWLARFPEGSPIFFPSSQPDPNAPYQIEANNTTGGEILRSGLGEPFVMAMAPIISWADEASSGSVTFALEDGTYSGGFDIFYSKLPELRAQQGVGAVEFYIGDGGITVSPGDVGSVDRGGEFLEEKTANLFLTSIS